MSTFKDLESVIGLIGAIDSGKMDEIYGSVAQRIASGAAKELAEAADIMGPELFKQYVPQTRASIRAQRDLMRLEHEEYMLKLERERMEVQANAEKAAAENIVAAL